MADWWENYKKKNKLGNSEAQKRSAPQSTSSQKQQASNSGSGGSWWETYKRESSIEAEGAAATQRAAALTAQREQNQQDYKRYRAAMGVLDAGKAADTARDVVTGTVGKLADAFGGGNKLARSLREAEQASDRLRRDLPMYRQAAQGAAYSSRLEQSALDRYNAAVDNANRKAERYTAEKRSEALDRKNQRAKELANLFLTNKGAYYGETLSREQIEGQLRLLERQKAKLEPQVRQAYDEYAGGSPTDEAGYINREALYEGRSKRLQELDSEITRYKAALRHRKALDTQDEMRQIAADITADPHFQELEAVGRSMVENRNKQARASVNPAEYQPDDPDDNQQFAKAMRDEENALATAGYVADLDSAYIPEEVRPVYYALFARNPKKAKEWAEYWQSVGEDQYWREIYEESGKDAGSRFSAFIQGTFANTVAGLDPFGEGGQYASKLGSTMIGGGAAGLTEKGLFNTGLGAGTWHTDLFGDLSLGSAYQLGSSMLQSGANAVLAKMTGGLAGVTGGMGTILLGSSAAAQDYQQKLEEGWDEGDAVWHALAAGAAEATFEYVSLDKLVNQDVTRGFLRNFFTQGGVEASEEALTTISNRITDGVISELSGNDDAIERRRKELLAQGYEAGTAEKMAQQEWLTELMSDALGGFVSGGLMSSGQYAMQPVYRAVGAVDDFNRFTDALGQTGETPVTSAKELTRGSAGRDAANLGETLSAEQVEAARRITGQEGTDSSGPRTAGVRGPYVVQNDRGNTDSSTDASAQNDGGDTAQSKRELRRQAREQRKQSTRDGAVYEQAVQTVEQKISQRGIGAVNEIYAETVEQFGEGAKSIAQAAVTRAMSQALSEAQNTGDLDRITAAQENAAPEVRQAIQAAKDAKAFELYAKYGDQEAGDRVFQRMESTGAGAGALNLDVETTEADGAKGKAQILGVTPGAEAVTLSNGQTVAVKDLAGVDADTKDVLERLGQLDVGPAANVIWDTYREEAEAGRAPDGYRWMMEYTTAFDQGRQGSASLEKAQSLSSLSKNIVERAYRLGTETERSVTASRKEALDRRTRITKKGATGRAGTVNTDAISGMKLSEAQNRQLAVVKRLAEVFGIDVEVFASKTQDRTVGGKTRTAYVGENGSYKDGKIRLDINAGLNYTDELGSGLVATMSHELTHYIQEYAPEEYAAYKRFVLATIRETQGQQTLERLIWQKQQRSRDGLSRTQAEDEVVADAAQTVLEDSQALRTLAEEEPTLFQKVLDWIKDFFAKIQEALGDTRNLSEEAKIFRALEADVRETFGELWDKGITEATRTHERVGSLVGENQGQNSDRDAEYLELAKDPEKNRDRLQEMVDEAAKRAGYTYEVWHGTNGGDFTVFDWGKTQRADAGWYGRGHYFATHKGEAGAYGERVIHSYLRIKKPFNFQNELLDVNGQRLPVGAQSLRFMQTMGALDPEYFGYRILEAYDNWTDQDKRIKWADIGKEIDAILNGMKIRKYADGHCEWAYDYGGWTEESTKNEYATSEAAEKAKEAAAYELLQKRFNARLPLDPAAYYLGGDMDASDRFSEILKKKGYDGVLQGTNGNEIVVFDSPQIKSADPVTYDDDGNVIPLSERFNTENEDIRYSDRDYFAGMTEEQVQEELTRLQQEKAAAREKQRSLEKSDEYKQLFQAVLDKKSPEAISAFNKWADESGYVSAVDRAKEVDARRSEGAKVLDRLIDQRMEREEQAAIQKSGKSEAEYFGAQAVKDFGYTPYFYDAGYIVPNGKMLNFSGQKGRHFSSRGQDHRAIGMIYATTKGSAAMNRFMNQGNVRIMAESPGIDISNVTPLTKEQYATIRRFVNEARSDEYFNLDFSDERGNNLGSIEYEGRFTADRVLNDIRHFFETGEVRQPSGLSAFFSMRDYDNTLSDYDLIMGSDGEGLVGDQKTQLKEVKQKISNVQKLREKLAKTRADLKAAEKKIAELEKPGSGKFAQQMRAAKAEAQLDIERAQEKDRLNRTVRAERDKLNETRRALRVTENKLTKQIQREEDIITGKLKPLAMQRLLKAERDRAEAKVKEQKEEVFQNYKNRRRDTALRGRIRNLANELRRSMTNPTDRNYLPAHLAEHMTALLDSLDRIDEPRPGTQAADKHKATAEALRRLAETYNDISGEDVDPMFRTEYDDDLWQNIKDLAKVFEQKQTAVGSLDGDKAMLRDLSSEELEQVYDLVKTIRDQMRQATKLLNSARWKSVQEAILSVAAQQQRMTPFADATPNEQRKRLRMLDNMSVMRAVEMMSGWDRSSALYQMMQGVEQGTVRAGTWIMEYNKAMQALKTGRNEKAYRQALTKAEDYGATDKTSGRTVKMTKLQAIQLYMTWQREANNDKLVHLQKGGATIRDAVAIQDGKGSKATSHTVRVTPELIATIESRLTEWDRAYMKEVRDYLTKEAMETNKVLYQLKHRVLSTEDFYVPYIVDKGYLETKLEGSDVFNLFVKTPGSTQALQKKAPQPVIIDGMDTMMKKHVQDTANYVGLAIPIRDFAKVYNGRLAATEDGEVYTSIQKTIQENFQENGTSLILQALLDVQGGSSGNNWNTHISENLNRLQGAFVRSALLINPSVTIKQAASYIAAESVLSHRALTAGNRPILSGQDASNSPSLIAQLFAAPEGRTAQRIYNEIDAHTSMHYERRLGMSQAELANEALRSSPLRRRMNAIGASMEQSRVGHSARKAGEMLNPVTWIQRMDVATTAALWVACKEQARLDGMTVGSQEYWQRTTALYERALRETQPMYDGLHRTANQKQHGGIMTYLFPFRTVPIQNHGQVAAAFETMRSTKNKSKAEQNAAKKFFAKTVWAQTESAFIFSLMTFLAAAMKRKTKKYRDEDEELTPWSMSLGIGKDVLSTWFSVLYPVFGSELWNVGSRIADNIEGSSGFTYDAFSVGVVDMLNDLASSGDKLFSDAGKLMRGEKVSIADIRSHGLSLLFKGAKLAGIPADTIKTYAEGTIENVKDLLDGRIPALNDESWERNEATNARRYLNAWIDGDREKVDAVEAEMLRNYQDGGKSEKKAREELKSKLTAAGKESFEAGTLDKQDAVDFLVGTGFFDANEAYGKIMEWEVKAEHNGEEDYHYSQYERFLDDLEAGKSFGEAAKDYLAHGYTEKQLQSAAADDVRERFEAGEITEDEAVKQLTQNAGRDKDKAWKTVQGWIGAMEHPDEEDYSWGQYDAIDEALAGNKDVKGLVSELTAHGVKEENITQHIKEQLVQNYVDGKTTEAALKNQLSRYLGIVAKEDVDKILTDANSKRLYGVAYSSLDEEYRAGKIKRSDLKAALTRLGGLSSADADKKIRFYDTQKEHPDLELSEGICNAWYDGTAKSRQNGHQGAKAAGMSLEAYLKARETLDKITDTNGNRTGEDEFIQALAMMNLTARQKDALYYERYKGTTKFSVKPW